MSSQKEINQKIGSIQKKIKVVGIGGFGKVFSVQNTIEEKEQAMKEMSKIKIISKKSANSVMNERKILSNLNFDFLVNMYQGFQDSHTLYLIMDLLTGGDMRLHISKKRLFSETETKFTVACIILSLEYLATHNIIHRDLKPENLVMDHKGYIKLTDMGIARQLVKDNHMDTSGTPGYMSPEVICNANHDFRADQQALGIIVQEMMLGRRPQNGGNRKEIRADMLSRQEQIRNKQIPKGQSMQAVDFCNRLIQRKPANRLGANGIEELKFHEWFIGFDWDSLNKMQMKSPLKPISLDYIDQNIVKTTFDQDNYDRNLCSIENMKNLFVNQEYHLDVLLKSYSESTRATEPITHDSPKKSRKDKLDNIREDNKDLDIEKEIRKEKRDRREKDKERDQSPHKEKLENDKEKETKNFANLPSLDKNKNHQTPNASFNPASSLNHPGLPEISSHEPNMHIKPEFRQKNAHGNNSYRTPNSVMKAKYKIDPEKSHNNRMQASRQAGQFPNLNAFKQEDGLNLSGRVIGPDPTRVNKFGMTGQMPKGMHFKEEEATNRLPVLNLKNHVNNIPESSEYSPRNKQSNKQSNLSNKHNL